MLIFLPDGIDRFNKPDYIGLVIEIDSQNPEGNKMKNRKYIKYDESTIEGIEESEKVHWDLINRGFCLVKTTRSGIDKYINEYVLVESK